MLELAACGRCRVAAVRVRVVRMSLPSRILIKSGMSGPAARVVSDHPGDGQLRCQTVDADFDVAGVG